MLVLILIKVVVDDKRVLVLILANMAVVN
jgi:signal transduction histidine kinase